MNRGSLPDRPIWYFKWILLKGGQGLLAVEDLVGDLVLLGQSVHRVVGLAQCADESRERVGAELARDQNAGVRVDLQKKECHGVSACGNWLHMTNIKP